MARITSDVEVIAAASRLATAVRRGIQRSHSALPCCPALPWAPGLAQAAAELIPPLTAAPSLLLPPLVPARTAAALAAGTLAATAFTQGAPCPGPPPLMAQAASTLTAASSALAPLTHALTPTHHP